VEHFGKNCVHSRGVFTSQSSALVAAAAASYIAWGVPPAGVAARLKADARPALNTAGAATGVGILMIKPPSGR
jgi:hypothetical protein